LLTDGPEAEQADPELAPDALSPLFLQASFDGIADVGRHILEIRHAILVGRDAVAVVGNADERLLLFAAANNRDVPGVGVNAVLDELRDGLQRIGLGQCDDGNRVPVVANASSARLFGALSNLLAFLAHRISN